MPQRRLRRSTGVLALLALAACSHGPSTASAPRPTASPTSTAGVLTPTPTPAGTAVYPLTGLPVTSPAAARGPALSVKIDNISLARPQVGLNAADLVVDTPVEGGLTRLFAVFQSQEAPLVGPIRSARPVDEDLLPLLRGGVFAFSGGNRRELPPIQAHSGAVLVSNDDHSQYFTRASDRQAPHNVVSSTARLLAAGRDLGSPTGPPGPLFTWSPAVPAGRAVRNAFVAFSAGTLAGWRWDGQRYLRDQDGSTDRLTGGAQVSAINVVILTVQLRPTGIVDAAGNEAPLVVVTGGGSCWVLRDGVLVQGRWSRTGRGGPLRLLDSTGKPIALHPGRTWIELLPTGHIPTFS